MKLFFAVLAVTSCGVSGLLHRQGQDPCANCDEDLALKYQKCARDHGDPCAERNAKGLVSDAPGTKKDIGCCMKREKHDRCLKCAAMDCSYDTCKVNKKYYRERTLEADHTGWDKKDMEKKGWGKL